MKTFEYVAIDASGANVSARAYAASEVDLDRDLESRGLLLRSARVVSAGVVSPRRRLRHSELVALTTQLATITAAGVPLVEGLEGIGLRLESENARQLVAEMVAGLRKGESLSKVVERYPGAFSPVFRASIVAGEAAGALDRVLVRLAKYLEWSRATRATATQALTYPLVLGAAIVGLVLILLYFVLPRIVRVLPGGRESLPAETRFVLGVSDFLRDHSALLALVALVAGFAWWRWTSTERGRRAVHGFLLRIPRLGTLLRQIATSRFASTASILQSAGCDVFTMLGVAGRTCGNAAMEASFACTTDLVRRGGTITEGLERERAADPLLVQLVAVGERTGQLDRCFDRVVEHYDAEVPRSVKRFLSLLEPALLLGAGVVVAFILLAALLPIFALMENLH